MSIQTHDEYFAAAAPDARPRLEKIQRKVESLIAGATRCVSYRMPAFRDKRVFFYFAAFKLHIGIYPPVKQDAALIEELASYRGPKGNLSFPLAEPLPLGLIGRVAVALHREYAPKQQAKKKAAKSAPRTKARRAKASTAKHGVNRK